MASSPTADARFLFFGGKGGAGKTTCAAAAALALAPDVLALSLDPAHSLRDVLGAKSTAAVVELDAKAAFRGFMAEHREQLRTIADRGTYFDDEDIQGFLDLALPGLDEIMGLLELGKLAREQKPSRVVVDLPPTGHALRLFDVSAAFDQLVHALELMQGKHRFAVSSLTRRFTSDAIDAFLENLRASCQAAAQALLSPGASAFVLVARPEPMVLAETARYAGQLRELGAPPAALVLNAAPETGLSLPAELEDLPLVRLSWLAQPPLGPAGLRPVMAALAPLLPRRKGSAAAKSAATPGVPRTLARGDSSLDAQSDTSSGLSTLLEQPCRLTIFGGKGGVGKTTLAAATALALARRGAQRSVVVVSIDPAHSLGDSLGQPLEDEPRAVDGLANLLAIELEPERHWRELKEHWQAEGGQLFQGLPGAGHLDPVYDRQIAEQLSRIQPTGLDELAAATSVIDLLDQDPSRLVVVDSAPTGHLLRFLESPGLVLSWAKELMRLLLKYGLATRLKRLSEDLLELTRKTKRLDALLHDAALCEVVVVTLAEAPVLAETERLLGRLEEMRIHVGSVVLNQAPDGFTEGIGSLKARFPRVPFLVVPRMAEPVQGIRALEALAA